MEIKDLIRDPARIHACLQELPDGKLIALKPVKIYIPVRFSERGLAEIGVDTYICGIYAMTYDDKYYAVSTVNASIRIQPSSTIRVKINGVEYFEFSFDAGGIVMHSTNLVKIDVLVYKIYDEIISKGRVPWYLEYDDLGKIFDTAYKHAGARIGEDAAVTEFIISIIARNPADRTEYFRTCVNTEADLAKVKPAFIALKSVTYAATNTTNKLAGSYYSVGVVSALVSPSTRTERIENLLRR